MVRVAELAKAYDSNPTQTLEDIREALERHLNKQPGGLKPEEFSFRDLAAYFIRTKDGEPIGYHGVKALWEGTLLEDGVSYTAFSAITKQVINVAVMEGYQLPAFKLSQAVRTITGQTRQGQLVGSSIPLTDNKDLTVGENQEYPSVSLYGEYVKTPLAEKKGFVLEVTKETVTFDNTGVVLEQARNVGTTLGLIKEQLLVDYVIGAVANCVIEKRVGDSSEGMYNLFYTSGRYVNQQTNQLADWTDIDAAEDLFLGITMPATQTPPVLVNRFLLVPPQLRSTAFRIVNATETRSGTNNVVAAANPLAGKGIQVIDSELVYSRLVASGVAGATAAGTWFYGDLPRAAAWYEIWPLRVEEAATTSERSFYRDIVAAYKASYYGTPVIIEPRLWSKQVPS